MSHDGKYAITPNNGDETISIIDLATNKVAATLEAGPAMTGINFAGGKAFVISSTSGFVYVYNMSTLRPAGRIKIGTNVQLETATTDTADEKLYLAESTTHSVVIIDARTEAIERVTNVGLYPWGTHIMDRTYCHDPSSIQRQVDGGAGSLGACDRPARQCCCSWSSRLTGGPGVRADRCPARDGRSKAPTPPPLDGGAPAPVQTGAPPDRQTGKMLVLISSRTASRANWSVRFRPSKS
jgi:hypothetical protein